MKVLNTTRERFRPESWKWKCALLLFLLSLLSLTCCFLSLECCSEILMLPTNFYEPSRLVLFLPWLTDWLRREREISLQGSEGNFPPPPPPLQGNVSAGKFPWVWFPWQGWHRHSARFLSLVHVTFVSDVLMMLVVNNSIENDYLNNKPKFTEGLAWAWAGILVFDSNHLTISTCSSSNTSRHVGAQLNLLPVDLFPSCPEALIELLRCGTPDFCGCLHSLGR